MAEGKTESGRGKKYLDITKGTMVKHCKILPYLVGKDKNPADKIRINALCNLSKNRVQSGNA